jgi:hypothetical protein
MATDIGPPKAIIADVHPIATRHGKLSVHPWAFELRLCNDPILPFAARRALGLGQRSLRFDAVRKFWSQIHQAPSTNVTDETIQGGRLFHRIWAVLNPRSL